ncbi:MAG: AraC family transcriptional regulator [Clostridia bacterium]|nr:AraC family transcriptional regulator [Clostridia bacterium]
MFTPLRFNKNNQLVLHFPFSGDEPIFVRTIGWHKTPPSHAYGPAVRDYYLLHLIVEGKGSVERGSETVTLGAGEAFLICPDEVVTYRADAQEAWTYYWIAFDGSFAKHLVAQTTKRLYTSYAQSGAFALQNALNRQNLTEIDALNALFSVLSALQDNVNRDPTKPNAIQTACHYLENNYFEEIDVRALAARLGFSRAYFSTTFRQTIGESPYRFLMKIRLDKAKEYLRANERSVEEIARSVGFSCVSRFSEQFKRFEGVSPLQYRKEHFS